MYDTRLCPLVPVLWVVFSTSCLTAQSTSRNVDHTFDEDKPTQPIEGHAVPDLVIRRKGPLEAGHLQSLLAFATLYDDQEILEQKKTETSASSDTQNADKAEENSQQNLGLAPKTSEILGKRISREEISLILLDGKSPPAAPPAMPPDEDSVLLDSGDVLTGMVMVTRGNVYVAGQRIPLQQVTMIRLREEKETDPIPAREENVKENPQLLELSPFWVGTVVYRGHVEHETGDPDCKGEYITDTTVFWKMAFTEKVQLTSPDLKSEEYVLRSEIQLNPAAEHQSIGTAFCMNWGLYRLENHRSLSCMSWEPNPYKLEQLYRPTEFDRSQPSSEPVLGHAYYYSNTLEEKLRLRHEKNPESIPFKMYRSGSYSFFTPGLGGFEQGWPRQTVVDQRDGEALPWPYPESFHIVTHANLASPSFEYHVMQNNYQRMYGQLQYREIVFAEYEFHRVDKLPQPPEQRKPEEKEEEEEDCEQYRKQMRDNEDRHEALKPQIGEIISQYTDAMDKLRDTDGWKRLHPNDSLPDLQRLWKMHEEGGHFGWAELRPDELETFESGSQSDAEKLLARKVRKVLWELESSWHRYYQARMNADYYRQAAADCERGEANPKDAQAPPRPRPDTRFLEQRGGF